VNCINVARNKYQVAGSCGHGTVSVGDMQCKEICVHFIDC